jgi:hypothetical protein
MIAAISAYISLLEHDLVLALAYGGFDPAKDDLTSHDRITLGRDVAQRGEEARRVLPVLLPAGRGRPARTPFGLLIWALPVVAWTRCGESYRSVVGPCIGWRVGGMRDMPVEALFPESRERFELGSSGWSWVLGTDAVGGPPHRDFTDEGGA